MKGEAEKGREGKRKGKKGREKHPHHEVLDPPLLTATDAVRGGGGVLRLLDSDVRPADVVRLRPRQRRATHLGGRHEPRPPARLRVRLLSSDHVRLHERVVSTRIRRRLLPSQAAGRRRRWRHAGWSDRTGRRSGATVDRPSTRHELRRPRNPLAETRGYTSTLFRRNSGIMRPCSRVTFFRTIHILGLKKWILKKNLSFFRFKKHIIPLMSEFYLFFCHLLHDKTTAV